MAVANNFGVNNRPVRKTRIWELESKSESELEESMDEEPRRSRPIKRKHEVPRHLGLVENVHEGPKHSGLMVNATECSRKTQDTKMKVRHNVM